ncbi:MAG: T9SS type A sorting domain-containing protein [Crocinitomicaceae bacterium]|nr:T9SS type A sorting domain-containing protein [Crocinitomicaceae bacterium]
MKILLLILSLTFGLNAHSQNYTPFPDSNARWVNTIYTFTFNGADPFPTASFGGVEYFCMDSNDTLIGPNNYSQITYCTTNDYKGAIRDDNGMVYYVPKDSTNEYLLYDFTAQAGDTMTIYHESFGYSVGQLIQVTINSRDSILVGNDYRDRIYVDNGCWIEGIGYEKGLFLEPWPNVSNYATVLYCMSYNDTIYHSGGSFGGFTTNEAGICELNLGVMPPPLYHIPFYPIPNPTMGIVSWYMDEAPDNLIITNSLGQQVTPSFTYINSKVKLDLSDQAEGLYIVQFTLEGEPYQMRLIKE